MENYEQEQQKKIFEATGLREGDQVYDPRTGQSGSLYISGAGYLCVRVGEWRATIWTSEFIKDTRTREERKKQ